MKSIQELFGNYDNAETNNANVSVHGFPSQPTRTLSLDHLGGQSPFGCNDTIEIDTDDGAPEHEVGDVEFFSTRQAVTVELPSTLYVNRFNAQNKA